MERVNTGETLVAVVRFLFLVTLLLGSLGASPALAFRLVPFSATFTPTGPGTSQAFRVDNDTDQPIAVQIAMVHREMAADGNEQLVDAEDDFTVFPAQLVLLPGEGRALRVQWLGEGAPTSELPYRMIAEQLPVDLDPQQNQGARIKFLVRYEATIYVATPVMKPDLMIERVQPVAEGGRPAMAAVTVQNRGTAHAVLDQISLTLQSKVNGAAVTLAGDQLKGMESENVLAGHTRRFLLPWPVDLPVGDVEATMKVTSLR